MTRLNKKLSEILKMEVSNANSYDGVLFFTVETELEAYKAAYYYRYNKHVKVEFSENVQLWSVRVGS